MPTSVLINKKPGDGSISKLQEILQQTGNQTIVADLSRSDSSALANLAAHLDRFPNQPVNVVIDLWQAPNILDWSEALLPTVTEGVIAGRTLPMNSTLTVIMAERSGQRLQSDKLSAFGSAFDLVINRMTVDAALDLKRLLPAIDHPDKYRANESSHESPEL